MRRICVHLNVISFEIQLLHVVLRQSHFHVNEKLQLEILFCVQHTCIQ